MWTARKLQPIRTQIFDLLLVELTNWRWTWRAMVVLGVLTPLGGIFVMKLLLPDATLEQRAFILTGNTLLSILFENQHRVAGHIVFMRVHGTLEYFSSLPVQKHAVVVAIIAAFFLLSLPSFLVTACMGSVILDVTLHPSPALLLALPLAALPMAGIGAIVGTVARSGPEANSLGIVAAFTMAAFGAIVVPPWQLPSWVVQLGMSILRRTLLPRCGKRCSGLSKVAFCRTYSGS